MNDYAFDQQLELEKRRFSHAASLKRWERQGTTFAALATAFVGTAAAIAAYSKAVDIPELAYYPLALLISFSLSCSFLHDEFVCWRTELDSLKNFRLSHYPEGTDRFSEMNKCRQFMLPTVPGLMAWGRSGIFFWPLLSFLWPNLNLARVLFTVGYLVLIGCFTAVTVGSNVDCVRLRNRALGRIECNVFPAP